jgi:hypothetical protein
MTGVCLIRVCAIKGVAECNAAADRSRPIRLLSTTGLAGEAYCTWCILF